MPVGGGFGRVFKIGEQPVNMQLAAYYNVARPTGTADWQLEPRSSSCSRNRRRLRREGMIMTTVTGPEEAARAAPALVRPARW